MDPQFSVEYQYQEYLRRVEMPEEDMHPLQRIQIRQTFYAAFGQLMFLLRDHIGTMSVAQASSVLEAMTGELARFYMSERERGMGEMN